MVMGCIHKIEANVSKMEAFTPILLNWDKCLTFLKKEKKWGAERGNNRKRKKGKKTLFFIDTALNVIFVLSN